MAAFSKGIFGRPVASFLVLFGCFAITTGTQVAPALDFVVHSDVETCHGALRWITDDFLEDDWEDYGFGGCAHSTINGSVTLSFDGRTLISFVRIFTPSTGHMRNDHYKLEVCGNGICRPCDDVPVANAAEWSKAKCEIEGNEVVLTKKVPTQIQLIEIDVHGYAQLLDFAVQSDVGPCYGELSSITDNFLEQDWQRFGFGGCENGTINGSVTFSFDELKIISLVRIFTPSTGHMRNDYYQLEVCRNGTCLPCDDVPVANAAEWSEVKCGFIGNEVVLTKKVPTQIQLIEIHVYGYVPALDFVVQSDVATCHGNLRWITDNFLDYDWEEHGFGGCANGTINGSVTLSFDGPKFISFVRIFTPSTGHMRNDYYQLEVCGNGICRPCDDVPVANATEWSKAKCGFEGNEVVLTKKVPTQIQLIEIDVHGYEIQSVGSEGTTVFNWSGNSTSTNGNGGEASTTASLGATTMTPTERGVESFGSEGTTVFNGSGNGTSTMPTKTPTERGTLEPMSSTTASEGGEGLNLPPLIIALALMASKLTAGFQR